MIDTHQKADHEAQNSSNEGEIMQTEFSLNDAREILDALDLIEIDNRVDGGASRQKVIDLLIERNDTDDAAMVTLESLGIHDIADDPEVATHVKNPKLNGRRSPENQIRSIQRILVLTALTKEGSPSSRLWNGYVQAGDILEEMLQPTNPCEVPQSAPSHEGQPV